MWILMGLLFVGLAGFGATNLTGTVNTIGAVGNQRLHANDYFRELQQEIRSIESQTRQVLSIDQVRQLGLEQRALSRLVTRAALDHEAAEIGLSIGDANLQRKIIQISAFRGIDGNFDRDAYRFTLQQAGLSERGFEDNLRAQNARNIIKDAVLSRLHMPTQMADVLLDYLLSRRSFTWAVLGARDLTTPVPKPTEADLREHYDANTDDFTLPETKEIAYVLLTPDMVLGEIEVDESALRALYDDRTDQYNRPERRLVERLVFSDTDTAASAMAQLEIGGSNFDLLVETRGLALGDVDMGDVTRAELGEAGAGVFAARVNDVVGPLPSPLGPALFRINGILTARVTSFEDVRAELHDALAADRARRLVAAQVQKIDDLFAGGATLEEVAQETDMELGKIAWNAQVFDGIAAYTAFREAALAVTAGDFAQVAFLDDGSIFAIELRDTLPPRAEPFEDVRDRVLAGWAQVATEEVLQARAAALVTTLARDGDFAAAGLAPRVETAQIRSAFIEGTPPDFMDDVFAMAPGDVRVLSADGRVFIVRLDESLPPADTPETAQLRTALSGELDQALAAEIHEIYVRDARLRARPQIDERAVDAILMSIR